MVGPTNDQPRFLSCFDNAVDVGGQRRDLVRRPVVECGVRPEELRQRAVLVDHLERSPGVVDRRPDLASVPHDAGIAEQSAHVGLVESGHGGRIEAGERGAEVVALAQDREPRQAGLESLEAQLLEEPHVGRDAAAPLVVVVREVVGRGGAPGAACQSVRPDDEFHRASVAAGSSPPASTAGRSSKVQCTRTLRNCHGSSGSMSSSNRPGRSVSGVQSVK